MAWKPCTACLVNALYAFPNYLTYLPVPSSSAQRPIGYWLKRADALLTLRIEEAHRASGMTRVEWQVLDELYRAGAAAPGALAEALGPFAEREVVQRCLIRLEEQAMVQNAGTEGYRLTPDGERLYGEALERQDKVREQAIHGIHEDAYRTTLGVLQRLVENLEPGGRSG